MEAAKRILEVQVLVSKAEVGDKNYFVIDESVEICSPAFAKL